MNTNSLLLSPTFVLTGNSLTPAIIWPVASLTEGASKTNFARPHATSAKSVLHAAAEGFSSAMEYYIRLMLMSCAFNLSFPAYTGDAWARPRRLRPLLTPSLRGRVHFLDRDGTIWSAVYTYFRPMIADFSRYNVHNNMERFSERIIWTAWDTYMIILATKNRRETAINPYAAISRIHTMLNSACEWSRESRARWAVLSTLFRSYSVDETVPSLFVLRTDPQLFCERVEEILEDAYLLEASVLRRSFGIQENITATRRDLRKLLKFIVSRRPWAKGLLGVSSQGVSLFAGTDLGAGKMSDEIGSIVELMQVRKCAPFLIHPRYTWAPISYENQYVMAPIRNVLDGGSWSGGIIRGGVSKRDNS